MHSIASKSAIMLLSVKNIIIILLCINTNLVSNRLVSLIAIYRHGERTPYRVPKSVKMADDNQSSKPYLLSELGILTEVGQRQHHELGQHLRQRYNHLLPKHFNGSLLRIQSSDFDRTLISCLANTLAIFGNHSLPAIHTVPSKYDYLLSRDSLCPAFKKRLKTIWAKPENINKTHNFFTTKEFSNLKQKIPEINSRNFFGFADYLLLQAKKTTDYWLNKDYVLKSLIAKQVNTMFQVEVCDPVIKRLRIGLLLNEIVNNLKCVAIQSLDSERLNNNCSGPQYSEKFRCKPQKIFIYSAHDFTLGYLLSALGEPCNFTIPPFASTVLLEMYRNDTIWQGCDDIASSSLFDDKLSSFYIDIIYMRNSVNDHTNGQHRPLSVEGDRVTNFEDKYVQRHLSIHQLDELVKYTRIFDQVECFKVEQFYEQFIVYIFIDSQTLSCLSESKSR
ncbi:hypothetical protein GJ496_001008 [Pomphorhynchus laevis]|nr:hypothetical protein GJ496_001008 [Pomphorhynchus laevis]